MSTARVLLPKALFSSCIDGISAILPSLPAELKAGIIRGRAQKIISICEGIEVPEAPELRRIADLVCRSTDRIVKMVKGLKGLASCDDLEAFKTRPVSEFLGELTALSRNRFVNFDTQFRIVEGAEFSVLCRPDLIIQVFMNLINNALDAVKDLSERWVEIFYSQTADDVLITITDSERGIPRELQERITQPFFSTKSKANNSGLGWLDNLMQRKQLSAYIPNGRF